MKYNLFLYFIAGWLIFTSCESFLDKMPTGTMTTDSELKSNESALALVNSAYQNARVTNRMVEGWGSGTMLLLEYMTGKATSENSQSNFKDFQDLAVSARTAYIADWWQYCYAGIADCNLALEKIKEFSTLNEKLALRYEGEIKFMRAFYYFYLVRIFGDVPKILTVQKELSALQIERAPVKEIYDEIIIPDLLAAEQSGLPSKDETGRASLFAVKSLLSDVFITYAGYPIKGGDSYYHESAKRSLEIIQSNAFALFSEYSDLWNPANNNKGEFIYQIQHTINKGNNFINNVVCIVLPSRSGMSAFNLEFGSLIPTKEFVESYPPGDKRSEEKQFFFTTYKGHPNKFSSGAPELSFMDFKGYYIHKFFDKNAIDNTGQSRLNWTIYRYADILLLYAEAQVNADGAPDAMSIEALNTVRNRAGLSPFIDTNKETFEKAVWDQRYFELCYENKTWFDIVRTRLIRDDAGGNYVPFIGYTTNWGKTYTGTQLLFPIPLRERQTNSKLTQNPGY
ncbi:MAG: RagB/SusD family nutrient uptake outer membrane protein [Tannerella sp.]|jgi:hypothetical protein|nr:RagB/SusD family nutrient uptake outer membrane protein [Tannerella sp.]